MDDDEYNLIPNRNTCEEVLGSQKEEEVMKRAERAAAARPNYSAVPLEQVIEQFLAEAEATASSNDVRRHLQAVLSSIALSSVHIDPIATRVRVLSSC